MTEQQLELEEIGQLAPCTHCGVDTFNGRAIPKFKQNWLLPEGFTAGNIRHWVQIRGVTHLVCQNCRYDEFGAY